MQEREDTYRHVSVMPKEALHYLNCRPGGIYADCTLGGAGHSRLIAERIIPDGQLIAMDRDTAALENARRVLSAHGDRIHLFHGNFTRLPEFLDELNIKKVDGILADLGLSLYQLEGSGRGFSFQRDEPLDMRMNPHRGISAEDLINSEDESELTRIFKAYGEERWSGRIARAILKERSLKPIKSSLHLSQIIEKCVPRAKAKSSKRGGKKIHPATRVFMALRIAVNKELDNAESLMGFAPDILNSGGRLCVISFHSLEDRIIKHRIKEMAQGCNCPKTLPQCVCGRSPIMKNLTRKGIRPSSEEVEVNPMARSATLRAAEKL